MRLYDYGLGTLSQYDLTAERSARTRGALLCYTEQGLLILREFHGSEKKLKKQQELLLHLQANGISTDYFLENTQGSLVSQDKDGQSFTLQRWYEGQECDTRSREDIMKSVRVLAKLHIIMRIQPQDEYKEYRQRSLKEEYTRHNQELRKIRKFIRKKGPTCTFEKKLLAAMEGFLEKGEQAVCLLEQSGYEELREQAWQEGTVCHGEYNQHNVLISREDIAVTNFGRWSYDIQMADLYQPFQIDRALSALGLAVMLRRQAQLIGSCFLRKACALSCVPDMPADDFIGYGHTRTSFSSVSIQIFYRRTRI